MFQFIYLDICYYNFLIISLFILKHLEKLTNVQWIEFKIFEFITCSMSRKGLFGIVCSFIVAKSRKQV